jgi:ABC-type multidrug transport system fused ATPase/permease subunit
LSPQAAAAAASATAEDALGSIRTVRAFAQEHTEGKRYGQKVDESLQYGIQQAKTVGWSSGGLFALSSGAMVAVLWYGARLTIAGDLSAGKLSAFVLYSLTGKLLIIHHFQKLLFVSRGDGSGTAQCKATFGICADLMREEIRSWVSRLPAALSTCCFL